MTRGEETLTLTLSNPTGGNAWLEDAEAVGTIENTDAMPQAWLARFGRTVAEQVIEAVEGRFSANRTAGVAVTLAGERIDRSGAGPKTVEKHEARARLAAMKDWLAGAAATDGSHRAGYRSRSVTPRELLAGSSFALTGEAQAGGTVSLWGRGAVSRFDGRERTSGGDLSLDGEVVSAMMGADWVRKRWTAGLLVSRSVGEGGYRGRDTAGTVESTLTGLFPYGRYEASDRVTLWGVAGFGSGELTLTPREPIGDAHRHGPHDGCGGSARGRGRGAGRRRRRACGKDRRDGGAHDLGKDAGPGGGGRRRDPSQARPGGELAGAHARYRHARADGRDRAAPRRPATPRRASGSTSAAGLPGRTRRAGSRRSSGAGGC